MNYFHSLSGEGFKFDSKSLVKELWRATGKDKVAQQQSTEVTLTTDGVNITKNLNIVMMGIKETDTFASLPLIGSHLLKWCNNEDKGEDGALSMQSCFCYVPIKCIFGKKSSDFIQEHF